MSRDDPSDVVGRSSPWKRTAVYAVVPLVAASALLLLDARRESDRVPIHTAIGGSSWIQGKPTPGLGRLEATITERLAVGRVRIQARVQVHPEVRTGCRLELVVPEGCDLLEGQRVEDVPGDEGIARSWTVQFPTNRTLDAVVRYCADVGDAVHATEVALRVVTAE